MSSNGRHPSPTPSTAAPSKAMNVGFSSVADRYGESSSQVESRSSGKRSHRDESNQDEEHLTPQSKSSWRSVENESSSGKLSPRARSTGGFLLDAAFANGSPRDNSDTRGKRKIQDGNEQSGKRSDTYSRLSGDSSQRSSPFARDVSGHLTRAHETDGQQPSRPNSMDPAQLVQMALDLSESRKRQTGTSLQVPLAVQRRTISGPLASNVGTMRAITPSKKRVSHQNNATSRGIPDLNTPEYEEKIEGEVDNGGDTVVYTFSPATLSRAEKARKYFELASEYRRLLQSLPPLKPDSGAPGNFIFETSGAYGPASPEIARIASNANCKYDLGRQYNPIQALRNRRVRIREKKPFPTALEAWSDTNKVMDWVGSVETAAQGPAFRGSNDHVNLPNFVGDKDGEDGPKLETTANRHRRTDTVASVITRPENSWTIEPIELLADTYWAENDDNKSTIENRHGNPIFPKQVRRSVDAPKTSIDIHHGKDDEVKAGSGTDEYDDDRAGRLSRRRRLMLPLTGQERRKHRRLISRASSVSTVSSVDSLTARTTRGRRGSYENVGPLERYMEDRIAREQKGEVSSPEVVSPDHWDSKKYPPFSNAGPGTDRPHRNSLGKAHGQTSLEVPGQHRRARSADGRVDSFDRGMSSVEDIDMEEPASPVIPGSVPATDSDFWSPEHRATPDDYRSRRSKIPIFRSNSKDRNRVSQIDFANSEGTALATILSADSGRPRSSEEAGPLSTFKRHKTGDSISSTLRRYETNLSHTGTFTSSREPSSTVGRLFKGGRIGALMRNESSRIGDRFRNRDRSDGGGVHSDISRVASDVSDAEDDALVNSKSKIRSANRMEDESDASSHTSLTSSRPKQKFHLSGLPTFTSPARDQRLAAVNPISTNINRTMQEQETQRIARRPERFERLAPPRILLPKNGNASSPELATDQNQKKSYGLLAPGLGTTSEVHLPKSQPGIAIPDTGKLSTGDSQRHWSISNKAQPSRTSKITKRDISRVKALLLVSGIKAREIQRKADSERNPPLPIIAKATETTGKSFSMIPRKDEHLFAARMLSDHLTSGLSNLEQNIVNFRAETATSLASQLETLQHKASDHLTKLVHDTSDEADAFTVELTTRQPQQIKQVEDAVDAMLRLRRRQFRLLRRAGFKMLEWLLLGIMWWIWLAVVVFNIYRKAIIGAFRFLHWLFTF